MKSKHDISQRILQLEASKKNWVDIPDWKLMLLEKALTMQEEEACTTLQDMIDIKNYRSAKELMWVLDEETNIWFKS